MILLVIGLVSNLLAQWIGRRFELPGRSARRGEPARTSGSDLAPLTPTGNLRRRQAFSRLTEVGATAAAVVAVAVLAIVVYTVVSRGASALSFEFSSPRAADRGRPGDRSAPADRR